MVPGKEKKKKKDRPFLSLVSALAEVPMTFETHDASSVYINVPWYLMPLNLLKSFCHAAYSMLHLGNHTRLSILITITNVVTNLFSAAEFVLYGYILCQIIDIYVFLCIYEK